MDVLSTFGDLSEDVSKVLHLLSTRFSRVFGLLLMTIPFIRQVFPYV